MTMSSLSPSLSLNGCGSRQVVVNWVFKLEWSVVLVAWTDGQNGQVGRRNYYYGFIYISWGNLICCFCIFFCVFVNIYIYYKGRFQSSTSIRCITSLTTHSVTPFARLSILSMTWNCGLFLSSFVPSIVGLSWENHKYLLWEMHYDFLR